MSIRIARSVAARQFLVAAVAYTMLVSNSLVMANPIDPSVVAGQATFAGGAGTLSITTSDRAIINWGSFSIGAGELTQFIQPGANSAVLNRVTGGDVSQIFGALQANGQVFLVNPNGVYIGPGARIDVGSFMATTLDINNAEFMRGGDLHFSGNSTASVVNHGSIRAIEGNVYLVGHRVENHGNIQAGGYVGLAAAQGVKLVDGARPHLVVTATADSTANATGGVLNAGSIEAAKAELLAAHGNVYALAINNRGTIRANGVEINEDGIFLVANGGRIVNTGHLIAKRGASGGLVKIEAAGGSVEISGKVDVAAQLHGPANFGGSVQITADNIKLAAATLDASGHSGGGIELQAATIINQAQLVADAAGGAGGAIVARYTTNYLDTLLSGLSARGGGSISVLGGEGTHAFVSGTHDASSLSGGVGGSVTLTAETIVLRGATLLANGQAGGGQLNIGGGYQGANPALYNATSVDVGLGVTLSADAIEQGNGGTAVVWSDHATRFGGLITARGGALGGDGGMMEVSGRNSLAFYGMGDASAASGAGGTLLLDPHTVIIDNVTAQAMAFELLDPNPATGNDFGEQVFALDNGRIIVTARSADVGGVANAGAVYLFDGANGGLVGGIVGSTANDQVGDSISVLDSDDYVVRSVGWDHAGIADAGAVTLVSGNTGLTRTGNSGTISALNSLVGVSAFDQVGNSGITVLANGDYVVSSTAWRHDDIGIAVAGAATLVNGATGLTRTGNSGIISAGNSLVGSSHFDRVGIGGITLLANGDYVVKSPDWDRGGIADAGAVTLVNGSTGLTRTGNSGTISDFNSLVGTTADDRVGSDGITMLANGDYVVRSRDWDRGGIVDAGAVTLINGNTGLTRTGNSATISAANSLVGSSHFDRVGNGGITLLANGDYVVHSPDWDRGGIANAGAVTLVSGSTGLTRTGNSGTISDFNSLVGTTADDRVGNGGITLLANGDYVVNSRDWDRGGIANAGAVTLVSGSTGLTRTGNSGTISDFNSLVGTTADDRVGNNGVTLLANGDYVVRNENWDNAGLINVGAVTLVNGATGLTRTGNSGTISELNSLVGSTAHDLVGNAGITLLPGGDYVVNISLWDNAGMADIGAVTLINGTTGLTRADNSGIISAGNSLVGSYWYDYVGNGGTLLLPNGDYVVRSPDWDHAGIPNAGAVTLVNGATGLTRTGNSSTISAGNSLVGGSSSRDKIGSGGVTLLASGDYVVSSPEWDHAGIADVGAVTLVNGGTGLTRTGNSGTISAANSLIGATGFDYVGKGGITPLANGDYVVRSHHWGNAGIDAVGAVTLVNGATGLTRTGNSGTISEFNSLIGSSELDSVGISGITLLANGDYVVRTTEWNHAGLNNAGAVTLVNGATGLTRTGNSGIISAANSLVGSSAGDIVGNGDITLLPNGDYIVTSFRWDNAGFGDAGAVTLISGTTGLTRIGNSGIISATNSLVGESSATDLQSVVIDTVNETYIGRFVSETSGGAGGRVRVGLWNPTSPGFAGDFSTFASAAGDSVTITPARITDITNTGTAVVVAANTDLVVNQAIATSNAGNGGDLSLLAGRSVLINANITTDGGDLTLVANHPAGDGLTGPLDAHRDAGAAVIAMALGTTINTGGGNFLARIDTGAGLTNNSSGDLTLTSVISGGSVLIENRGPGSGGVLGDIVVGANTITITGPQGTTLRALGDIRAYGSIVNTAGTQAGEGGVVNLIAGWDGQTGLGDPFNFALIAADATSYGNGGSVYINPEDGTGTAGVAVGSRFGATNVAAYDLALTGSGSNSQGAAYAQLGYRGDTAVANFAIDSPIHVALLGDLAIRGGSWADSHAHIGHGGRDVGGPTGPSGSFAGAITLDVAGDALMYAGNQTYAQIGHGGKEYDGTREGDITLSAANLDLRGGYLPGQFAYAQIGHGGASSFGNLTGDIALDVQDDISIDAGGFRQGYGQVGHGGFDSEGDYAGSIDVRAGGNLTLVQDDPDSLLAMIGHGGYGPGARQGNIDVRVEAETSLDSAASRWQIGHLTFDDDEVSNANVTFITGTLDYTHTNATPATQTRLSSVFAAAMRKNLDGGHVTIGSTNTNAGPTGGMLVDGAISTTIDTNLSFASAADLRFARAVTNGGAGQVNLVAGWDGATGIASPLDMAAIFADPASYGNNAGSVLIGDGTQTAAVAVGSHSGQTNLAAFGLTLRASDTVAAGRAQLGSFDLGASGAINVALKDHLVVQNASATSTALIGHGGESSAGDIYIKLPLLFNNAIDVAFQAAGDVRFLASVQEGGGTQAGEGGIVNIVAGWDGATALDDPFDFAAIAADTDSYGMSGGSVYINLEDGSGTTGVAVGSRLGATNVAAYDLTLQGGAAYMSYAQIGFRAMIASADPIDSPVDVMVKNSILARGGGGSGASAQIGHGLLTPTEQLISNQAYSGALRVVAGNHVGFVGGSGTVSYAMLGHGGFQTSGARAGDITLQAGGGSQFLGGRENGSYAQLGHGGLDHRQGALSGDIRVDVTGDLVLQAGTLASATQTYAQLGHGGRLVVNNGLSGAIEVTAGGDVQVRSGHDYSHAQLGHGGFALGGAQGDIRVDAGGAVSVVASSGEHAFAQLGHGGNSFSGDIEGDLHLQAHGDVAAAAHGGARAYAQIGHGDAANLSTGLREGAIDLLAGGGVELGGQGGQQALLGHGTTTADGIVGNLTLALDQADPLADGGGFLQMDQFSAIDMGGAPNEVRIFDTRRDGPLPWQIAPGATINGVAYTPGPEFINSPHEQWGPDSASFTLLAPGPYAPPFTLFFVGPALLPTPPAPIGPLFNFADALAALQKFESLSADDRYNLGYWLFSSAAAGSTASYGEGDEERDGDEITGSNSAATFQ